MFVKNTASRLDQTVRGVETMTRFALAVLALASGVYTYLGVRDLLDGSATFVFFAAIVYSVAVSVAIYAFWSFMLRFVPLVTSGVQQRAVRDHGHRVPDDHGDVGMAQCGRARGVGGLSNSAWRSIFKAMWAISTMRMAMPLPHSRCCRTSREPRNASRGLLRTSRKSGSLTGTTGSGSVVQLLTQMAAQMTELQNTITGSRAEVTALFEQGSAHLAKMRELVSGAGDIKPRADEFSAEVVQLTAVISALQETGVAPSVKRAAQDLSLGFIAPVADGQDAGLVVRQDQVMENVRTSVAAQSTALTAAADEDSGGAEGRAAAVCAAEFGRSGLALLVRLHSFVGRRDLDRPLACRSRSRSDDRP